MQYVYQTLDEVADFFESRAEQAKARSADARLSKLEQAAQLREWSTYLSAADFIRHVKITG